MNDFLASYNQFLVIGMVIGALLALFVSILWICLPFAIFGIKPRLNEMIQLLREIRNKQERLLTAQGETSGEGLYT